MGITLVITRSGHDPELYGIGSIHIVPDWIRKLSGEHDFKILDGTFPVWIYPETLDDAIREVSIFRDDILRTTESDPRYDADAVVQARDKWDRILSALSALRSESGWEADFG